MEEADDRRPRVNGKKMMREEAEKRKHDWEMRWEEREEKGGTWKSEERRSQNGVEERRKKKERGNCALRKSCTTYS